MNKQRRADIEQAKSLLEGARDEEQEYYDNMPENLQASDKGEAAENAVSNLDEAISAIEEALA